MEAGSCNTFVSFNKKLNKVKIVFRKILADYLSVSFNFVLARLRGLDKFLVIGLYKFPATLSLVLLLLKKFLD